MSNSCTNPKSQSLDCSYWLKDLYCCLVLHKTPKETCHSMWHQWHGLQAEGRCRFFKWQDELGNGPTALQQQPGPAVPSPQRPNKSEGAPAAAAGGSGFFADEGELTLDTEGQIWQQHDTFAVSTSVGSIILMLRDDALLCQCLCVSLCSGLLLVHAAPQYQF